MIDLTPPLLLRPRLRGPRTPAIRRLTHPPSTCSTAPSTTCRAWRGRPPSTSPAPPPSPIPQVRAGFPPPRLDVSFRLALLLDPVRFLVFREEEEDSAGQGVPHGRGDALEDPARQWPR
jgi:hypothetical protein